MTPLIFVTLVAVGAAIAIPAAHGTRAAGDEGGRPPVTSSHPTGDDAHVRIFTSRPVTDRGEDTGRTRVLASRPVTDRGDGTGRVRVLTSRPLGDRGDDGGRVRISVSRVECPAGRADVVLTSPRGHDTVEYSVYRDNGLVRDGVLWSGVQRSIPVYVEHDGTARIAVRLDGQGTTTYQVRSRCGSQEESYGEYHRRVYSESSDSDSHDSGGAVTRRHRYNPLIRTAPNHLPYTGPPADFYGKIATAAGMIIFGAMLLWVGMLWPRRVPEQALTRPRPPYGRRRP
ncbi:hypothetical protein [Sphaerisporangium fuscum]|uniref:hypothetical protein n=1 Tax=Sphaerisporangium fuscum TaxID=2835868 RepID=UPI001BDDA5A7|nr:hypothetical protein [Sphaerisporangium fuscum]